MRLAYISHSEQKVKFAVSQTDHRIPWEQECGVTFFGPRQLREYKTHLWTREKELLKLSNSKTIGVEAWTGGSREDVSEFETVKLESGISEL